MEIKWALSIIRYFLIFKGFPFHDMAPMSLKKLFTFFQKPTNPTTAKLHRLFHDMSFLIPLHDIKNIRFSRTMSPQFI